MKVVKIVESCDFDLPDHLTVKLYVYRERVLEGTKGSLLLFIPVRLLIEDGDLFLLLGKV